MTPIRLFVGADGGNCDLESQMVLEYSVRKHASQPVDIVWMQQAKTGPYSGWKVNSGRTPFTHFRWSIPAMCEFEGRGIYCDSDFIFMVDIAELWTQDIPNVFLAKVGKKGLHKTCCMIFDCAAAKGFVRDLDTLKAMPDPQGTMMKFFTERPDLYAGFSGDWNCLDLKGYESLDDPRIKAIHYSRMEMQPHLLKYAIPRLHAEGKKHWYEPAPIFQHERPELQALFDRLYAEALDAGYTLDQYRFDGTSNRKGFAYTYHQGRPDVPSAR